MARSPTGTTCWPTTCGTLRPSFELQPRAGTPEADAVPGADDRVVVRGTPPSTERRSTRAFLGATVLDDGLMAACQFALPAVTGGDVRDDRDRPTTEAAGCGAPGATDRALDVRGASTQLYTTDALTWPGNGARRDLRRQLLDRDAARARTEVASFVGEILGTDGRYVQPGTRIEAYIGTTRCGVASTRRTGSFSGYTLFVVGPDAVPGCQPGETLTFRVDGQHAAQTVRHDPGDNRSPFDLTVP